MKNADLNYIIKHFNLDERNVYSSNVKAGVNGTYIDFLHNSDINHRVTEVKPAIKTIEILTKNNTPMATIENPIYPNNNNYGISIMKNKFTTENHLKKFGIRTTDSKIYTYNEMELAEQEFFKHNPERKAVIKPLNGSLSRGVYVNVSKDRFADNWNYSLADRKNNKNAKVIVQEYLEGFEVRATILQGKLVSIIARVPSYVTGDGNHNINELIKIKNKIRKKCNYLRKHPININNKHNEFLLSESRSIEDIPDEGEHVLLSAVSNIINGGEIFNITDLVADNIKDFALNTLAAFPNMYSGGLDIMLKSFDDLTPYVLETNHFPVITLTKYPTFGKICEPEKILIESLISQYQFTNESSEHYQINDEDKYIKDFINFSRRQVRMNDYIAK